MGYKHDQRLPSEIHDEYLAAERESADEPLPPYSEEAEGPSSSSGFLPSTSASASAFTEPMSPPPPPPAAAASSSSTSLGGLPTLQSMESTDSITPTLASSDGRRILLMIYIHGFVGDETSFGVFPAHVHSLLSRRVADTHVVHTKVFPKYKTRRNIAVVRDQFSAWLAERESARTDIVLVGHSMGGILAADVALMPEGAAAGQLGRPMGVARKHRIVGTLNLDVPFLGMHPKVIGAGISSLFAGNPEKAAARGVPAPAGSMAGDQPSESREDVAFLPVEPVDSADPSSSVSSFSKPSLEMPAQDDQYFNPTYANDARVPSRKALDNIVHFVNKHATSDGLLKAGTSYVSSHLEFGGTMADYKKLDRRYQQLRALEREHNGGVRFVNYFTTCQGRPKVKKPQKVKTKKGKGKKKEKSKEQVSDEVPKEESSKKDEEDLIDFEEKSENPEVPDDEMAELTLTHTDPIPVSDSDDDSGNHTPASSDDSFLDAEERISVDDDKIEEQAGKEALHSDLPQIPAEPVPPPAFDVSKYTDKDALKLGKSLHSQQLKAYQKAFKDRERVMREREKIIRKREEKRRKDDKKAEQDALKQAKVLSKEQAKEEQKKRLEEKNAEKEAQKKLKALEKEAAKEKKEADKAEKLRLKQLEKEEKAKAQAKAGDAEVEDDDDDTDKEDDKEGSDHREDEEIQPTILKKRKLRTFCLTPPKATAARRTDWIPVFIADTDQVGAHCGLFKQNQPHYEPFVERVVERIEDWVEDLPSSTVE